MSYIVDFNPVTLNNIDICYYAKIQQKIQNKKSITPKEANDFLDMINYMVRFKINKNLDNYDNKCDLAVSMLYHYLNRLDCSMFSSMTQNVITSNIIGHSFLTLQLLVDNNIKNYLLDPTYIQFFKKEKCSKKNYYISPMHNNAVLITPDPGFFIKDNMKEQAQFLLNHGHILLTEENAQMYGDSFYNTKTGNNFSDVTYQTIPGKVYINAFTKGKEPISKTEEELESMNLNIQLPQEPITQSKKR